MLTFLTAAGLLSMFITSCKNEAKTTGPAFDTTCVTTPFKWTGDAAQKMEVVLSVDNCIADTLSWTHKSMETPRMMHVSTLMDNMIQPSKDAVKCVFVGNKYAWLTFNDAFSGRGFMVMMPFDKKESLRTMKGAINSFDKKFVLPDDLRAYSTYNEIFVEDINTGKTEKMSYKEEYTIKWNKIHETIDSVNISHKRIFVQLIRNGEKVQLEKAIDL